MEKAKTTLTAERVLTEHLREVMVRALRPGFHGRGTISFDVKDGQLIATDVTLMTRTLARKEYDHN